MITNDRLTDAEFDRIAFDVLRRELGADGLARFIRLHRSGKDDYTVARADWQKEISVEDIAESIRSARKQRN